MSNDIPLSNCHQAPVTVRGGDEGTSYYVCGTCHKACDLYQKTPHNRTLSEPAQHSTKVDTSSIAPAEAAELRDELVRVYAYHLAIEKFNSPQYHTLYDAPQDANKEAAEVLDTYDTQQASRIRAEVLDLVEREVIGEDYIYYGGNGDLEHAKNALRRQQRAKLASLRQKPGERGQR